MSLASQTIDVNDIVPKLGTYVFKLATGTPILSGWFVERKGVQVHQDTRWSGTIDIGALTDDVCTLLDLYKTIYTDATAIPDSIIGFQGRLTGGTVYYNQSGLGISGKEDSSSTNPVWGETPDSKSPIITATDILLIGRIG